MRFCCALRTKKNFFDIFLPRFTKEEKLFDQLFSFAALYEKRNVFVIIKMSTMLLMVAMCPMLFNLLGRREGGCLSHRAKHTSNEPV